MQQIICADAIEALTRIESGTVDMCVTSPPYYGLRDYGVDGQIGLEETPDAYIARLVSVFREVRRVLRDDGTLWVNIADSYAGSGKGGNPIPCGMQDTNLASKIAKDKNVTRRTFDGIKRKDLIGIPWTLAFALRADGWYLRQDIIWHKPNPMPESVTDRCTRAHEHIFLLSKQPRYYFNAEAISEPVTLSTIARMSQDIEQQAGSYRVPGKTNGSMKAAAPRYGGNKYTADPNTFYRTKSGNAYEFRPFRNKRDVWTVSTTPFKGTHFATFPKELVRPCVLAGSRPDGIVLDPFFGAGTTGLVAVEENRGYIGIEINPEYVQLAQNRIESAKKVVCFQ